MLKFTILPEDELKSKPRCIYKCIVAKAIARSYFGSGPIVGEATITMEVEGRRKEFRTPGQVARLIREFDAGYSIAHLLPMEVEL